MNGLNEHCWACGHAADATNRRYGPLCNTCLWHWLRVWSRGTYDDFTCADLDKGHMWYMRHECIVTLTSDRETHYHAWCVCGRELVMPSITPRWEVELNEILQRLGVSA